MRTINVKMKAVAYSFPTGTFYTIRAEKCNRIGLFTLELQCYAPIQDEEVTVRILVLDYDNGKTLPYSIVSQERFRHALEDINLFPIES